MKKFIKDHSDELEANENMPKDTFSDDVTKAGVDFNKKYEEYFIFALTGFVLLVIEILLRNAYLRKIP